MSSKESCRRGAERCRFQCLGWALATQAISHDGKVCREPLRLEDPFVVRRASAPKSNYEMREWQQSIQEYHDYKSIWRAQLEAMWLSASLQFPSVHVDFSDEVQGWCVRANCTSSDHDDRFGMRAIDNPTDHQIQSIRCNEFTQMSFAGSGWTDPSSETELSAVGSHVSDRWCNLRAVHSPSCPSGNVPSRLRLLDERSSMSVNADPAEHDYIEGLERNGDPEDEQLVIIDGWQDLLEILHQRTPSPDSLVHLEMYGLHITHHSIRITDCEATIAAIREAVQQSWRDAMPPRSVAYIHLVRPQEQRHARAVVLQLLVEIVPFGVDIPPNDVPILRRIRWHSDHSMTLETSYMRDHQTGFELLFDSHLDEWCHPRHGVQCNLHIESRIALMANRHYLSPGSLLEIFIHDDNRPEPATSSQNVDLQPGPQQATIDSPDLQELLTNWRSPQVSLVMYGLCGSSLGTRYSTSQVGYQQVRDTVLLAWEDHVRPGMSVMLHMVRPQDNHQPGQLHLIVEITSQLQGRPDGYLPILQRISWHNIWQGDTSAAVYRVSGQNMHEMLAACSLAEWCGPSTRAICRLQVERRSISFSELIEFQAGSLIEVLVSLQHVEDDGTSFLQERTIVSANCGTNTVHTEPRDVSHDSLSTHVIDRWCDSLSSCDVQEVTKVRITQARPNGDITPDRDGQVPYQYRLHNGARIPGTIIPPPNWNRLSGLRYADDRGAVIRDATHQLRVHIRSWLLPHDRFGPMYWKDCTIPAQLFIRLLDRLTSVWQPELLQGDRLRMRIVQPTPAPPVGDQARLHILLECNRPHVSTRKAILLSFQELNPDGPSPDKTWIPYLAPQVITPQIIAGILPVQCDPRHLIVPAGTPDRRWLAEHEERAVDEGLYLPTLRDVRRGVPTQRIEIDEATLMQTGLIVNDGDDLSLIQRDAAEATDSLQLMQRSGSRTPRRDFITPSSVSSSLSPVLAHVFHLSSEHRLITFDRAAPLSFFQQLESLWKRPAHAHAIALHEVKLPPSDLETSADVTFIFEQAPDRTRQAAATDQLILLDIEISGHGETTPGKHIRRVLWSRRLTNRQAMLSLTASVSLCEVPGTTCELSINHHIWPAEDTAHRHVLHGDFIRLRIDAASPSAELHTALCDQEFADAQRYVFGRSPSRSTTPSEPVLSDEGAGQSDEAASPSLLQLSAAIISVENAKTPEQNRNAHNVDSSESMNASDAHQDALPARQPDKMNSFDLPHVDDRWCARPFDFRMSDCLAKRSSISLSECIPAPIWLRIPITDLMYLAQQLTTVQMGLAHGMGQVVNWNDATKSQFDCTPPWTHELPLKYQFFTDGSSIKDPLSQDQRQGASAIVMIVETDQGPRWGGSRTFLVEDGPTAPKTEIVAIVLALLWCIQVGDVHPHSLAPFRVAFGYDCQAAGHVAAGQWRIKAHQMLQTHGRALALWVQHRFNVRIEWEHIHSHTGHPWNEAADALSWAAVHQWFVAPSATDILQLDVPDPSLSSWLWMIEASYQKTPGIPLISDRQFLVNVAPPLVHQATSLTQPFVRRQQQESPQQARTVVSVELKFATANVLTLYDSEHLHGYISARQETLMEQMFLEQLHIIGTQETRSKCEGYLSTDRYHVLAAAATKRGSGGMQLWVSKTFAFTHRQMQIGVGDLKILHATSKRLVVRISSAWIRLIVVVCHAPASSTFEEAESYWKATSQAIPLKYQTWPTVYLCDANARIGEVHSPSVGGHGAETESPAGTAFHHWLQQHELIAPQTFAEFHRGPHSTWTHAKGTEARLDYVILDQELVQQGLYTHVSDRIDLTTVKDDHQCVCAVVPWGIWDHASTKGGASSKPEASSVEDILQVTAPNISWQCNVHDHAAQIQQWLYSLQPPKQAARKRKTHMTEDTWQQVGHKRYHWKRIRQLRFAYRSGMQNAIFRAWKLCRSAQFETPSVAPWLTLIDHQTAQHWKAFTDLSHEVRTRVRADDKAYYEQIAAHTAAVAADEGVPGLWKAVKAILPKQRSKMKHSLRACGPDPQEISQHFQTLEAGNEAPYDSLLSRCQAAQQESGAEIPLVVPLQDMPSRIDMEQVIMKQKARNIHCIAKKSGSLEAHKMRGIMLLDSLAKAFHALVRQSLLKWMTPRRLPCQLGGFSAQQTLYATQLLRSVTRIHQRHGLSSGVLFVDVRAAFHSLLREMAFGGQSEFPTPLKLQLLQEGFDIEQLQAGIDIESSEFTTTAPPVLRRLAQETHRCTWFTLSQHDCSYQTHRGSRPGSPLADLAYNVMMRNALLQLTQELEEEPAFHQAHQIVGFRCPPLAWVDDVAIPFATAHAQQLDEAVLKVLHIVHRVFTGFGLRLNLEKGKTEAVLQYRGQEAADFNKITFVERLGRIPIPPAHGLATAEALRVVSDYGYLGTVFSQTATLGQELRTRTGKANFAFQQLRKPLFANKRLAIHVRITLLNSLVVSILMHGAGNWPLLSHRQFTKLGHTIVGWHRTICGVGFWSQQQLPDHEVLAQLGVPPLAIRLMKHRLLFAFQWVTSAPQIAIECITADDVGTGSWMEAIRHAIHWFLGMTEQEPQAVRTTEETYQWLWDNRITGPRRVRNAVKRFCLQQTMIADVIAGHRRIYQWCMDNGGVFALQPAADSIPGTFPCDLCERQFHNAQALQGHRWKWHGVISSERRFVYDSVCRGCGQCFWTAQRLQQHLRYSRRFQNGCYERVSRYFEPLDNPAHFDLPAELQRVHRLPKCNAAGPMSFAQAPVWQQRQQKRLEELRALGKEQGYEVEVDADLQWHIYAQLKTATLEWSDTIEQIDISSTPEEPIGKLTEMWWFSIPWSQIPSEQVGVKALLTWGQGPMYELLSDELGDNPEHISMVESAFLQLAQDIPQWRWMSEVQAVSNWQEPIATVPCISAPLPAAPRRNMEEYIDMLQCQSALLAQRLRSLPTTRMLPVFRDASGHKFILVLHLFSGRRRVGDCVHWARQMSESLQHHHGVTMCMVSVDTAIHATQGDLDVGRNYSLIVSLANKGIFAAVISGPPCETWSAARNLPIDDARGFRGPRPLRDAEAPWGLAHRTQRELCQTQVGSRLMVNSLHLDVVVTSRGGTSLMEHPDRPGDPSYASSWRTDLHLNVIQALPDACEHHIQQWRYGAASVKPTLLRALGHKPHVTRRVLRQFELANATYPTQQLGGKNELGEFRTAAAKEYPEQLCKCIVAIVVEDVTRRLGLKQFCVIPSQRLEAPELQWLHGMTEAGSEITRQQWLPDYQPVA